MERHDGSSSSAQRVHPSSDTPDLGGSIAAAAQSCSKLFQECAKHIEYARSTKQTYSSQVLEQGKRYDLWARNIAASQPSQFPTSLEYRLRSDANARKIVQKALDYVNESLEMIIPILSGDKQILTWEEEINTHTQIDSQRDLSARAYREDPEFKPVLISEYELPARTTSELAELSLSIQEGITNLFELSMIIRKRPEKDDYIKASLRYNFDPKFDINHVGDKYPVARSGEPWLMERLGTAITRRRQYLLYRKEHQKRSEEFHQVSKDVDGKTVWSGTKASTFVPDNRLGDSTSQSSIPDDPIILSSRPQTEYADSSRGKDAGSDLLRTPLLPKGANGVRTGYGEHFECPYCWPPQTVQNKNEWKKHIFSDLRPYVCTFEGCGLNMFESQNQWFDHETRFHRKQWQCNICHEEGPMIRSALEVHMKNQHASDVEEATIDASLDECIVPRIDATKCPLCKDYGARLQRINQSGKCDVSLKQFQEHLGRHMEQLALASLPEDDRDEEYDEDDDLFEPADEEYAEMAKVQVTKRFGEFNRGQEEKDPNEYASPSRFEAYIDTTDPLIEVPEISPRPSISAAPADHERPEKLGRPVDGRQFESRERRSSPNSEDDSSPLSRRFTKRMRNLLGGTSKVNSADIKRADAKDYPQIPGEELRHPSFRVRSPVPEERTQRPRTPPSPTGAISNQGRPFYERRDSASDSIDYPTVSGDDPLNPYQKHVEAQRREGPGRKPDTQRRNST